ncbi:MAG: tetratricopeptide repeat protein [Armatimonadetes bacterium]|nr:tetratricopeptide repeat protein [Armatimonadota bacterium]
MKIFWCGHCPQSLAKALQGEHEIVFDPGDDQGTEEGVRVVSGLGALPSDLDRIPGLVVLILKEEDLDPALFVRVAPLVDLVLTERKGVQQALLKTGVRAEFFSLGFEKLSAGADEPAFDLGLMGPFHSNASRARCAAAEKVFDAIPPEIGATILDDPRSASHARVVWTYEEEDRLSEALLSLVGNGHRVLVNETSLLREVFSDDQVAFYSPSTLSEVLAEECKAQSAKCKLENDLDCWTYESRATALAALLSGAAIRRKSPTLHESVLISWARGDQERALELLRELEDADPVALNDQGIIFWESEKIWEAQNAFRKAIELRPSYLLAHLNLAQVLAKRGAPQDALEACTGALQHTLQVTGADFQGLVFLEKEPLRDNEDRLAVLAQDPSAEDDNTVSALKSFHMGALYALMAAIYYTMNMTGEAQAALQEAAKCRPLDGLILHRLALLYSERGMVAQPIKYFNAAIMKEPFLFEAQAHLASFYVNWEMYDRAIAQCLRSLKVPAPLNTQRIRLQNVLATAYFFRKEWDFGIRAFQASLDEGGPREGEEKIGVLYVYKALDAFRDGDKEKTWNLLEKALSLAPNLAQGRNLRGVLLHQEGRLEEAVNEFQEALRLEPEIRSARSNLDESELALTLQTSPRPSIMILSHGDPMLTRAFLRNLAETTEDALEWIFVIHEKLNPPDFLSEFPQLRLLHVPYSGVAEAYNKAMEDARGNVLVFMEDDLILPPNWLTGMTDVLKEDLTVGLVGPKANWTHNPGQMTAGEGSPCEPSDMDYLDDFCLVTTREAILEVGGFDERFKVKGPEDQDLSLRMKLSGYRVVCAGDVVLHHHGLMPFLPDGFSANSIDGVNQEEFERKWSQFKESYQMAARA